MLNENAPAWQVFSAVIDIAREHLYGTYRSQAIFERVRARVSGELDDQLLAGALSYAVEMMFIDKVGENTYRYHITAGTRQGGLKAHELTAGLLRSFA